MKKWLTAVVGCFLATVASANCWEVKDQQGTSILTVDITVPGGKYTQYQPAHGWSDRCTSFVSGNMESMSCYDSAGNLALWLIVPDPESGGKAIGLMMIIPVFDPTKLAARQSLPLTSCVIT